MSYDKLFHEKYRLLIKFKRKFGTTNIPSRPGKKWLYSLNDDQISNLRVIGRFVETLRCQYKKGVLSSYKVDMLNHINFEWIPKSEKEKYLDWKEKVDRLEGFKKLYGHCNVPENWHGDLELAAFVASSRQCYKRGKIGDVKRKVLEQLGFDWAPGQSTKVRSKNGRFVNSLKTNKKV